MSNSSENMRRIMDVTRGLPDDREGQLNPFSVQSSWARFNTNVGQFDSDIGYHTATPLIERIEMPEDRLWEMKEDHVVDLMNSIARHGLIDPIAVQYIDGNTYRLVYGAHRLEAVRRLRAALVAEQAEGFDCGEWSDIPAIVFGPKAPKAYLQAVEAIENLHRRQLTDEEQIRLAEVLADKKLTRLMKMVKSLNAAEMLHKKSGDPTYSKMNKLKNSNNAKPVGQKEVAAESKTTQTDIARTLDAMEAVIGERPDYNDPAQVAKAKAKVNKVMADVVVDPVKADEVRRKLAPIAKEVSMSPGRAANVANKAEAMGHADRAEEIRSAPKQKLKKVASQVAADLKINPTARCQIELHHPPEVAVSKILESFGREYLSALCLHGLKLLKETPISTQ